ncbi:hypothetical protein C8J57DRAFT_1230304 [Mycena rebaudengoi]|nr:hypothetical protein C8J57DRAFT_1250716 [Mycena rebaudengoi]KAJ7265304.1 hypothetical protein C8J57DRAFT_1230304 [Mycena rebaudengoi]
MTAPTTGPVMFACFTAVATRLDWVGLGKAVVILVSEGSELVVVATKGAELISGAITSPRKLRGEWQRGLAVVNEEGAAMAAWAVHEAPSHGYEAIQSDIHCDAASKSSISQAHDSN